ncbi:MAG: 2-C-methyl-D-erythritol 4-phosphate cytidylyltransferase [Bacteroidota bacterium]|nr:2-C-methyl-D-erythritol 4-phosphate cytidylyltransferase [Bacteroidota bacterium]
MPATFAIIVAGGSGNRMNASVPKQFLELGGKAILMHSVKAFYDYDPAIGIRVVLPEEHFPLWKKLCRQYSFDIPHELSKGGTTRTESVRHALQDIGDEGLVAIHDGVRPLVSQNLIHTVFTTAFRTGNAVPAIPVTDSIREITTEGNMPVCRDSLRIIQTPQVFDVNLIKKAYALASGNDYSDDATVFELLGMKICLVDGIRENIKITLPEDLVIASALLSLHHPG